MYSLDYTTLLVYGLRTWEGEGVVEKEGVVYHSLIVSKNNDGLHCKNSTEVSVHTTKLPPSQNFLTSVNTYKPDLISHSQKSPSELSSQSLEKSSSLSSFSMERYAISFSKLALSTGFPLLVGTTLIREMTECSNKMSPNLCNVNVLLIVVPH
jgi:hypothetical protein